MVYGEWCMVHSSVLCIVCGSWCSMVYGVWIMNTRCMVYGVWCMVYGVWCVFLGSSTLLSMDSLKCVVYGVWCMVYGVWCVVYGV